ncbi:orexin receptor type 2-like isoform X2 [Atheta coriaria]|uniref:orexin receptor type 2-like isoform X2 n=1 Tax=Dalotia coriaria TaxID=877792 RepID=UPI0031F3E6B8
MEFVNETIISTNITIPCNFDHTNYVVIGLYVPVGLIALIANVLVITVVVKFHYMRNITNYFLVNLSIADLLVTIVCMPMGAWSAYTMSWKFGQYPCKLLNYMQCISVASSVFTITAMALDRYIAINQPFAFGPATRRSTITIIMLLWAVPMIIFSPLLIVTNMETYPLEPLCAESEYVFCGEDWDHVGSYLTKNVFSTIFFLVMFAIPGVIIFLAYAMMGKKLCSDRPPSDDNNSFSTQQNYRIVRERKRVAWILLLLVVIFASCWLPYNTARLLLDFQNVAWGISYDQYTLLLGHMNSALNPIIYCVMSKNFRTSLRQLLCTSPINYHNGRNRRLQVQELLIQ